MVPGMEEEITEILIPVQAGGPGYGQGGGRGGGRNR